MPGRRWTHTFTGRVTEDRHSWSQDTRTEPHIFVYIRRCDRTEYGRRVRFSQQNDSRFVFYLVQRVLLANTQLRAAPAQVHPVRLAHGPPWVVSSLVFQPHRVLSLSSGDSSSPSFFLPCVLAPPFKVCVPLPSLSCSHRAVWCTDCALLTYSSAGARVCTGSHCCRQRERHVEIEMCRSSEP